MQNVLSTLIDKKNMTHNDWLKERNEIDHLNEEIEEKKKQMELLLAIEQEVDVAIGLVRGELDANAIGETTRDKGQPAKADEKESGDNEPAEEPAPVGDSVRESEEPTPEPEPSASNEEGKTTGELDKEQVDGKEGDNLVAGNNGKE